MQVQGYVRELSFPDRLDKGFVHVHLVRTKSSVTLERKTRLLKVSAPAAQGVCDMPWAPCGEALRERYGLTVGEGKPLMPAPRLGGWSSLPITCAWACLRLRRLLRLLLSFDDHSIVGTHSCKWTTPTWCAAYGPDRASRSLSDYQRINKAAGVSTEVVYETDALAAPLRAYGDVLRRVKEGQFLPDNELRNQFVDQFDSSSWQCRRRRRICRAT